MGQAGNPLTMRVMKRRPVAANRSKPRTSRIGKMIAEPERNAITVGWKRIRAARRCS
jgi:hypothetical protein